MNIESHGDPLCVLSQLGKTSSRVVRIEFFADDRSTILR